MKCAPETVWLMSGNKVETLGDGSRAVTPEFIQRVVIAKDVQDAYETLAIHEPSFVAVGHATLIEYQEAVAKILFALGLSEGKANVEKLPVLTSSAMS